MTMKYIHVFVSTGKIGFVGIVLYTKFKVRWVNCVRGK